MLTRPYLQPRSRPLKKIGLLLGGLLALSVEGTILGALMVMVGIYALGALIWRVVEKCNRKSATRVWSNASVDLHADESP
jgi:hypothetical protein